jgi:hypothetical protein
MNTAENTPTVTSTAVVETPKTVTTPAQKPLINYGAQGVKLASLEDAFRFANAIVASGFAPRGMEKPEAVLVAIQLGAELGLTPMAALQNTAVINGRPAIYGDAALALVRASGLLESFSEEEVGEAGKDSFGIKVAATRRDGSKGSETFTIGDAKAAKLWGKAGPWTDYPRRMLKFRARGFVLRDVFGDVLKGLRTAEEVRDYPEERNITPLSEKVSGGLTMSITQGGAS